jgi:hypothetical protein
MLPLAIRPRSALVDGRWDRSGPHRTAPGRTVRERPGPITRIGAV